MRVSITTGLLLCTLAAGVEAKPWKGAEMITQQTFRYGAFEARILAAQGSGMITPFFLYKDGSEVAGAQWEELDFEIFGKDGRFQTQVMTPGKNGAQRTEHVTVHDLPTLAWEHYYTYRMEWTPTQVSFYVDGQLMRRETDVAEFGKLLDPNQTEPMRLRVSIWAGDFEWSGAFDSTAAPAAMYVNWIQAYSYTPGTGPSGSDFTLLWRDDLNATDGSRWYWANWTFDVAVNDYIAQNSAARSGYLVQVLTADTATGQFPAPPVDDGSVAQPTPPPGPPPPPPMGPFALPARIEAEAFARFFDTTGGNYGDAVCGSTDVDVQLTTDPADRNCNVGWTDPGEWLEYDLTVASAAGYDLTLRVASLGGQSMHVEIDGVNVSSARPIPGGGWQAFSNVVVPSIRLTAGAHVLRLVFDTGQTNINFVEFKPAAATPPAAAVAIPATIQAEAFARFLDTTAGNFGDASCGATAVDAQITTDAGGGCNIGWTDRGEWLEYDVGVATAATFDLTLRVASAIAAQTLHAEIDGRTVGGLLTAPANGWQAFQSLVVPGVALASGNHVVRLVFDSGSVNVNYLAFAVHGGAPPPSCSPRTTLYQAEAMSATTGGPITGGWNLWSNGSLSTTHTFQGGSAVVRVSAAGQPAAGVWPHMLVKVGSQTIGDKAVSTTSFASSSFSMVAPAGAQSVSISFDNDFLANGEDRNLLLDAVTIDECPAGP